MSARLFIAYSRCNAHYALRLHRDLKRAGLDAWLDADIPIDSPAWAGDVDTAIDNCTHFLLLASPDAAESEEVNRELGRAAGKAVITLLVGGRVGDLPAAWRGRQVLTEAVPHYWRTVRELARGLSADARHVRSPQDMLDGFRTAVGEAADELTGAERVAAGGREWVKLPLAPSGYCMAWLFAPAGAAMARPAAAAVLFNFTAQYPGDRYRESLAHWAGEAGGEPWMVMLEGPLNRERPGRPARVEYEVRTDKPYEWGDAVQAGWRLVGEFGKADRVGFYFNCLLPLAFEVGLRTTMQHAARRVYHYNARRAGGPGYELAHDGWA